MTSVIDFKGTLISKEQLVSDVFLFSFKLDKYFCFKPGEFILVKVDNGVEHKFKAYSVFSPPSQKECLDLCIKIIPDGFASKIFDNAKIGVVFDMRGPFGDLVFDESDGNKNHFFVGVGSGVAPFHCMAKEFVKKYPDKNFKLLFGVKMRDELVFHNFFLQLDKDNDNFEYLPTLTREEWDGRQGRVQHHLGEDFSDTTFYLCGLKEMVLSTKNLLIEKGVEPKNIKYERYS
ncbi:MAG: hypothetical protein KKF89_03415 [Nanoarchaeota archaeon]|nr:hypothetical protein [Nanoarchaeota archaeon]MBU1854744.1 hypothetical protein [Nanoarchaeota archaeon]